MPLRVGGPPACTSVHLCAFTTSQIAPATAVTPSTLGLPAERMAATEPTVGKNPQQRTVASRTFSTSSSNDGPVIQVQTLSHQRPTIVMLVSPLPHDVHADQRLLAHDDRNQLLGVHATPPRRTELP